MSVKNSKISAINYFFVGFIVISILFGAYNGKLQAVTDASFEAAKGAVTLAIGLIGIMALWLGLVRILEAGGLMYSLAEFARPFVKKLFPDVPEGHPAMSAMLLNMSANALGLGNAATPFGLKAMAELNKINPLKGTATNAMCLFLAINTSGLTIFPLGIIGVRAAAGASKPTDIFIPTLLATLFSTIIAVCMATFLAKRDKRYIAEIKNLKVTDNGQSENSDQVIKDSYDAFRVTPTRLSKILGYGTLIIFFAIFIFRIVKIFLIPAAGKTCALGLDCNISSALHTFLIGEVVTYWLMPTLMLLIISYGFCRGVKMYEAVTDGAKQGFEIAIRIIPFLVAILVAIGMFRASGAMDILTSSIGDYTSIIGLPAEVLPAAILRPLSGTGAFAVITEIINHAPDSYAAYVASILMGCTETTFYVMAVYFGSVGISRVRHALLAGITADLAGIIAASLLAKLFWTGI